MRVGFLVCCWMAKLQTKEEALALTTTLQNPAESVEARCAACDAVLALTKSDSACAVLCSAGGIHAVINAMKNAIDYEPLLKGTVLVLRNLYRFDSYETEIRTCTLAITSRKGPYMSLTCRRPRSPTMRARLRICALTGSSPRSSCGSRRASAQCSKGLESTSIALTPTCCLRCLQSCPTCHTMPPTCRSATRSHARVAVCEMAVVRSQSSCTATVTPPS